MAFCQGGRGHTPNSLVGRQVTGLGGSYRWWTREDEPGEEGEEGAFQREVSFWPEPGVGRGVLGGSGSVTGNFSAYIYSVTGVRQTDG